MPNLGGWVQDDPRKIEKTKIKTSSQMHSKGRKHIEESVGLPISDHEFANIEILAGAILPSSYVLPFPTVQNQGGEGSCVPHITCYAKDIDFYIKKGHTSFSNSTNVFSPEYVYNQIKSGTDCGTGSAIETAFSLMVTQGVCFMATMPYSGSDGCATQPNDAQRAEAALYKISGYSKTPRNDRAAIKTLLSTGHPLVFGWLPDNNLIGNGVPSPYIWSGPRTSGLLPHCCTLIGYDDSKSAYKILNSWGSGWEDSGCLWIDYDWFETGLTGTSAPYGGSGIGAWAYSIDGVATNISYNIWPKADAGPDQTITLPTSSVTLDGTASHDPDGTISAYAWLQLTGPSTSSVVSSSASTTVVNSLVEGIYTFALKVYDNFGNNSNNDNVQITVSPSSPPVNLPPTVEAGSSITITLPTNSVVLNGAATDSDGTISSYAWTQVSGPSTADILSPTLASTFVANLIAGTYQFKLTATDNGAATGYDVVTVNVNPVANTSPIANAGFDQTSPIDNNVIMDGSASYDPDGYIASWLWIKISGPSSPTINNSTSPIASIVPSVAGSYVYQLTVTDNLGLSNSDSILVVVSAIATDEITLDVNAGSVAKGYKTDILTWSISLINPPIAVELQNSTVSGVNSTTLYDIVPYVPQGSYPVKLTIKKPTTRYYRIRVTKSDGSVVFSGIKSIK